MSRIHTSAIGGAAGVPNTFATIGAQRPAALKAVLAVDAVLATGCRSRKDQETIKLIVSDTGFDAIKGAGYTDQALAEMKPDDNSTNDTAVDFPPPS